MRRSGVPIVTAAAMVVFSGWVSAAEARPRVTVETQYYAISGSTGAELMQRMQKSGPRHGFMARAIAQTAFTPKIEAKLRQTDGICRVVDPTVSLSIRYTYPKIGNTIDRQLSSRWRQFMVGVEEHENYHGRLAKGLAADLEDEITRFAMADRSKNCRRADRELSKRIKRVWKRYDKAQQDFDRDEHRKGGKVYRMIDRLVGG